MLNLLCPVLKLKVQMYVKTDGHTDMRTIREEKGVEDNGFQTLPQLNNSAAQL